MLNECIYEYAGSAIADDTKNEVQKQNSAISLRLQLSFVDAKMECIVWGGTLKGRHPVTLEPLDTE